MWLSLKGSEFAWNTRNIFKPMLLNKATLRCRCSLRRGFVNSSFCWDASLYDGSLSLIGNNRLATWYRNRMHRSAHWDECCCTPCCWYDCINAASKVSVSSTYCISIHMLIFTQLMFNNDSLELYSNMVLQAIDCIIFTVYFSCSVPLENLHIFFTAFTKPTQHFTEYRTSLLNDWGPTFFSSTHQVTTLSNSV